MPPLDISRLGGVTPAVFDGLMKLTFVDDEKRAVNPLFPAAPPAESAVKTGSPPAVTTEDVAAAMSLEKELDEEIGRAVEADDVSDHNADKKTPTAGSPPAGCVSADSLDAPVHHQVELCLAHMCSEVQASVDADAVVAAPAVTESGERVGRASRQTSVSDVAAAAAAAGSPARHQMAELQLLRIALLQLGALKAIAELLASCRYSELLLVPKSHLCSGGGGGGGGRGWAMKDDDLGAPPEGVREAVRAIMKQLVRRAVAPSPLRRSAPLHELERAHSVHLQVALVAEAEDERGVTRQRGQLLRQSDSFTRRCLYNRLRPRDRLRSASPVTS